MRVFKDGVVILVSILTFGAAAKAAETGEAAAATAIPLAWWIAPVASVAALVIAYIFYKKKMKNYIF